LLVVPRRAGVHRLPRQGLGPATASCSRCSSSSRSSRGLSWLMILRRREGFRRAFAHWDIEEIAAFGERDVERLLADSRIIRHRRKIEATIADAVATQALHERGETFDALLRTFAPERNGAGPPTTGHEVPASTPESKAMAKELKRRGFRLSEPGPLSSRGGE
jgi:DNA-3-methyladenine glycosylase I